MHYGTFLQENHKFVLLIADLNCKCYSEEDNSLHGHVEENQTNSWFVKF